MSLLSGMYNCSGGSYIHMWNANAYSDCSSSPRFPASCPLRFAKTIPRCLQQNQPSLFYAAPSVPLFIKVSCQIFTLITYAYCMSCCWMQVASHKQKKSERSSHSLYWGFVCFCIFLHVFTNVSLEVLKHFDNKKRHFIVMLKLIHPTDHTKILRALSVMLFKFP